MDAMRFDTVLQISAAGKYVRNSPEFNWPFSVIKAQCHFHNSLAFYKLL